MAKAKEKKSSQARWAGFVAGKRVQVISGDHGNARGTLHTAPNGNSHCKVLLDQRAHGDPVEFHASNLRLL